MKLQNRDINVVERAKIPEFIKLDDMVQQPTANGRI